MKRWCWLVLVLILGLWLHLPVAAKDTTEELYREQLSASGAENLIQHLPRNVQELLESLSMEELHPEAYTTIQMGQVVDLLMMLAGQEGPAAAGAFGVLLAVVLISALLGGLEGNPHSLTLSRAYHTVGVLAAGSAVLVPLFALMERIGEAVDRVAVFMGSYVPVYAGILITSGSAGGGVAYQTTLLTASQILTWLIRGVVFPALLVSLALGCTGSVTDGFALDRFSGTLHKTVLWLLGLFSALFSGVLSLQQMVAAAGDSLSNRAVKFSLSSLVPVVGNLLGEAYATVMGCSGLLRSTVGGFGLVVTVLIVAAPLVSCICWQIGLHLAGGVAGLFGLTPLEKLCRTAAGTVRSFIAVLAVFALLMILATTVVAYGGGGR